MIYQHNRIVFVHIVPTSFINKADMCNHVSNNGSIWTNLQVIKSEIVTKLGWRCCPCSFLSDRMIAESAIFEVTSRQKQIPQSWQKHFQRQNPKSIDLFAGWNENNKKDVLAFDFICDKKDASAISYNSL